MGEEDTQAGVEKIISLRYPLRLFLQTWPRLQSYHQPSFLGQASLPSCSSSTTILHAQPCSYCSPGSIPFFPDSAHPHEVQLRPQGPSSPCRAWHLLGTRHISIRQPRAGQQSTLPILHAVFLTCLLGLSNVSVSILKVGSGPKLN